MNPPLSGGCLCGRVRYQITAEPFGQGNCHCRACQHATGGAFVAALLVATEAFTVTGDYREYAVTADSGNQVHRGFCPTCGTTLFARTTRIPTMHPVFAVTLDEPDQFKPQADFWTGRAQPWVCMDPVLPKFKRDPPGAMAGLAKPAPKD